MNGSRYQTPLRFLISNSHAILTGNVVRAMLYVAIYLNQIEFKKLLMRVTMSSLPDHNYPLNQRF